MKEEERGGRGGEEGGGWREDEEKGVGFYQTGKGEYIGILYSYKTWQQIKFGK